jgi:hypothetical protein
MNAASISSAGMSTALVRFENSAARTAANPLDNIAAETVERVHSSAAFKANAAAWRTADEMVGAVLDILA